VADGHLDRARDHEVINRDLLQGLAVIAKANGRSLVEELNAAIATYVSDQLPQKLGDAGLALFLEDLHEAEAGERTLSPSHS
jgi:hypothetical protein